MPRVPTDIPSAALVDTAPFALRQAPDSSPAKRVWALTGALDAAAAAGVSATLAKHRPKANGAIALDCSALTAIDGVGVALLVDLWRQGQQRKFSVELRDPQPQVYKSLDEYRVALKTLPEPKAPGTFEALGGTAWQVRDALFDFMVLAADVTVSAVIALFRPKHFRWSAVLHQASLMGSQAFGIVGLITFLIGLTLAFQSAYQLRQFGAAIYVATLTAISMVREMGPLITAILVAGRSGSSITSEVATMKVGEEIDALQVMGISFVDFIAVPKLIAMVTMVPLLTMLADLLGIIGGWIVGTVYLDIAPQPYLQKTVDALVGKDLATSLFKSVVFAWGIALIGLYHGIQVHGGAAEVGKATTASVVSAIFFIIVADSVFSVLF